MRFYTVHAPPASASQSGGEPVFVSDGFSWSAVAFGPLWFIFHRLWLALIGWILIVTALVSSSLMLGLSATAAICIHYLLLLLLGWEAASLRRYGLARRGYTMIDVAAGGNADEAALVHFSRQQKRPDAFQPRIQSRSPLTGGASSAGLSPVETNP